MDAIDILGGLLGGGSRSRPSGQGQDGASSGGEFGGRVLEELLKAGMGRSAAPTQAPTRQTPRGGSVSHRSIDVQSEIERLEDLLGVAQKGRRGSGAESQPSGQTARGGRAFPSSQTAPSSQPDLGGQFGQGAASQRTIPPSSPSKTRPPTSGGQISAQDEALVLIRAMINAAKADGKLDQQEQQAILSRVPNDSETIGFLRQEFAQPLELREFVWSVPLGLEVQVYTMSVATIHADNRLEVQYLQELAHGLRLDPELCNQIHAKIGAPPIF